MRGWGRDAYGEGYYGSDKAPLFHRVVVFLTMAAIGWTLVWIVYHLL